MFPLRLPASQTPMWGEAGEGAPEGLAQSSCSVCQSHSPTQTLLLAPATHFVTGCLLLQVCVLQLEEPGHGDRSPCAHILSVFFNMSLSKQVMHLQRQ